MQNIKRGSINTLKKWAKHKVYLAIKDRIYAIIFHKKKWPLSRIGAELGFCKSWVSKWINRYKNLGIEGLFDKPRSGHPNHLTQEQEEILKTRIQSGPTKDDTISVFRGHSIKDFVASQFKITFSLSGIYSIIKRLGFKKIKPRPRHEKNDKTRMQQWKSETLPSKIKEVAQDHPNKKIELWYQDEMRYGKKTRMTYEWKLSGTSYQRVKQLEYENNYIFGAVQPESGKRAGLVFPECNTEIMSIHLGLISQEVGGYSHAIVILDGAGWHSKSGDLIIPYNITLLDLPPYSPELNPMENVWKWLRDNFLSNKVIEKTENLIDVGCELWNRLSNEQGKSICLRGVRKRSRT